MALRGNRNLDRPPAIKEIAMWIIPLSIASLMLGFSWQKWADILIDFGRELYIPWRLSLGDVLYRDIAYFNGPLSPYLNAFLFKTFGVGLMTLALFNIAVIFFLMYIIYRFFLITSDTITAVVTASVFISIFAFSWPNHNFVCPYSHEMTHGVLLAFLSIYLFLICLGRRSRILLVAIGALAGLTFLTKIEIFLAAFTALIFGFCSVVFAYRIALKKAAGLFAIFLAGFFTPIILFVLFFCRHMPFFEVLGSFTTSYRALLTTSVTSIPMYQQMRGFDAPLSNVIKMFIVACGYMAVLLFIMFIGRILTRIDTIRHALARGASLFMTLLAFVIIAFWINIYIMDFTIFRPLPLVMLASGIYFFISFFRLRADYQMAKNRLALAVMAVFGFFLLFKILLNTLAKDNGFALAMPSALLLMKIFTGEAAIGRYVRPLAVSFAGIFLLFNILCAGERYARAQFPVTSGRDAILIVDSPKHEGEIVRLALRTIDRLVSEDETFIVLPEGVMLNYLARRNNPCPYINFMPLELGIFREEVILDSFVKSKPDYIILVERDTTVYGSRYFGRDYGKTIFKWVKENYTPAALAGCEPLSNKGFGILMARRVKARVR